MYGFVESSGFGYVLDNYVAESVFGDTLVVVEDCLAFFRGTDGGDDGMASFEENVEDVSGYEAGAAY